MQVGNVPISYLARSACTDAEFGMQRCRALQCLKV